jgi:hypothetical protein
VSTSTRGSCLCGAVAFTVAPPYPWFAHCHCSLCRKQHGSLFGTSLGVARSAFRWLQGADEIAHYRVTSAFDRPFCRHCGAAVPAVSHDERYWHVPAGLLDGAFDLQPRSQIFVGPRSPLTELDDALPGHESYPPGSAFPPAATPHAPTVGSAVGGSCLCGAVAFAADALPRHVVHCYCSLCRRSRGAAFSSTLLVRAEEFRFVSGEERVVHHPLPAPRRYATNFCADCGSPMPSTQAGAPNVMLPAGAIDTPLPQLPAVHFYVDSKAAWYDIPGAAPQFAELPPPHLLAELFR